MNVGVPREIMDKEYRVSMVPSGVNAMVKAGHRVFVEKGAGLGSEISDTDFEQAGAQIVDSAREVFLSAEMIINRIRWQTKVETTDKDYKINNDYKPFYSRLFIVEHPQHKDFFRLRQSVADNLGSA